MSKVTKLTLSVPSRILKQAKSYAKIHKTSLSSIVTRLFQSIYETQKQKTGERTITTAIVTAASIGMISLPHNKNKAELISDSVSEKYKKK